MLRIKLTVASLAVLMFGMVVQLTNACRAESGSVGRKQLMARARLHPCEIVGAVLGESKDGSKSCSKLREKNGDLIVSLVFRDGDRTIPLLKPGQRCPGGFFAPDLRSRNKARWVTYLEIAFSYVDDQTLAFEGELINHELLPNGKVGGTGSDGCGPEVEGRVRLHEDRWRLLGERSEGCDE
jgi:hypothetical protein